jgi:hypothetical protein
MGKPRRRGGILRPAIYGLAVGAVAAVGLHLSKASVDRPSSPKQNRAATLITPEGNGNCRRIMVSNDAPRMIDAATFPCDSITSQRAEVPPVMRGYQDSLGRR